MKMIDRPFATSIEEMAPQCLRVVSCAKVELCPTILPIEDCRVALFCGRGFVEAIRVELVEVCAGKFYKVCDFGKIVGPICPFDPVPEARFHKLNARIEELQVQVKELMMKRK